MNQLSLRTETPVEVDTNEVLRDYGLDSTPQASTVVQQGDSIITIPNDNPLEPPSIDDSSDAELSAMADELFGDLLEGETSSTDTFEEVSTEEQEETRDLDAEEDAEFEELLNEGAIVPVEQVTETVVVNTIEDAINLLPTNPKKIDVDETTSRFSGAMWYHNIQESTIVLAGIGGIGSWALMVLSRMKPKQIFIYDDDVVEQANLSGQLYSMSMIGKHKVDAMAEMVRDFSNYYGVQAIAQRFTPTTPAGDIMICGFDNMQARSDFFDAWVKHLVDHPHPEKCLFLDGRLSMEDFQVFCITGDCDFDIKRYKDEYLFSDYKAESVECSMKQTTYCANMIGSVIVNLFTNFIANQLSSHSRDLPFKTYYDASMMYLKTET